MGILCEAIRRRLLLEFEYDGKWRVIAPYCHGVTRRSVEVVRGVQVGGVGSRGFGKLWNAAKILNLRSSGLSFVPDDSHYEPNDGAMKLIHCRVALIQPLESD